MKTKLLNQLIADVCVVLHNTETYSAKVFGQNDERDNLNYLSIVKLKILLDCLGKSVQVKNRSYLLDLDMTKGVIAYLAQGGCKFELPSCEGLLKLTLDIADRTFTGNKEFAQSFFLQMVHPGVNLNEDEIAAAQAALNLLENEL